MLIEDVYKGLRPALGSDQIVQIAVVQEVEKSKFADVSRRAFGFQFPVVSCGATYAPKKVWGCACRTRRLSTLQSSRTSSHLLHGAGRTRSRIAADALVHALDAGRTAELRRLPRESQLAGSEHFRPTAGGAGAPDELTPPEWGVCGFSYPHIVQPVLDHYCVECHNARQPEGGVDLCGDRTDFFNVSYETLARQGNPGENPYTKWIPSFNGQEANILQVTPKYWGSPASKLADIVLTGHPDETGKPRVEVDPISQRRVFAWIDLNVPYYGTSESNNIDLVGCRQMVPGELDQVLTQVIAQRCGSCHEPARPNYTRITNAENNSFLLAPLARAAGGTERCGKPIFASKDDPDYQAILRTFDALRPLIQSSPRRYGRIHRGQAPGRVGFPLMWRHRQSFARSARLTTDCPAFASPPDALCMVAGANPIQ